jgi:hypothetical protein
MKQWRNEIISEMAKYGENRPASNHNGEGESAQYRSAAEAANGRWRQHQLAA